MNRLGSTGKTKHHQCRRQIESDTYNSHTDNDTLGK